MENKKNARKLQISTKDMMLTCSIMCQATWFLVRHPLSASTTGTGTLVCLCCILFYAAIYTHEHHPHCITGNSVCPPCICPSCGRDFGWNITHLLFITRTLSQSCMWPKNRWRVSSLGLFYIFFWDNARCPPVAEATPLKIKIISSE